MFIYLESPIRTRHRNRRKFQRNLHDRLNDTENEQQANPTGETGHDNEILFIVETAFQQESDK